MITKKEREKITRFLNKHLVEVYEDEKGNVGYKYIYANNKMAVEIINNYLKSLEKEVYEQ